jgi:hypothetical protein
MNQTKTIFVIAALIAAVGAIGIFAGGAPAAEAAQKNAPGQSACNPGLVDFPHCGPPGQNSFGNPGQCQLTEQEDGVTKEIAHDICHQHVA